jgi:hypothetical protein
MAILRSYSATTAQLGRQAQWRFDEAGGAIAVDSADGLDGEDNGSVTFGQTGPVGADGAVRLPMAGNGFAPVAELAGISGLNPINWWRTATSSSPEAVRA